MCALNETVHVCARPVATWAWVFMTLLEVTVAVMRNTSANNASRVIDWARRTRPPLGSDDHEDTCSAALDSACVASDIFSALIDSGPLAVSVPSFSAF